MARTERHRRNDTVTVTGNGTVRTTPDVASLRLAVEVRASELRQAYEEASTAAQRVIDAALGAGVARADVVSSGLSIWSETVWQEGSGPKIVGYRAGTSFTVSSRDLQETPHVLDAVVRAAGDALRIHGLALEVSDPASARAAAQEAAFDDARTAAERLAHRAGRELGTILSIDAASTTPPGAPTPLVRAAAVGAVESMPIEAGQADVNASVTVIWRLTAP